MARLLNRTSAKFLLIGLGSIGINLIVFQIFIHLFKNILLSTFSGNIASLILNYFGLVRVFRTPTSSKKFLMFIFTWLIYSLATIWLMGIILIFDVDILFARISVIAILTPLNYIIQKNIIFSK